MTHLCPHCGYDLTADEPIERGDVRSDPRGAITWRGETLSLSPAQRIFVHSLLRAAGAS